MDLIPDQLTELLKAFRDGDEGALGQFLELVMPELKRQARHLFIQERVSHTLQPTALVNEAFRRLFEGQPIPWENSRHFLCVATNMMRHVLVDHARRRDTQKRQSRMGMALDIEIAAPAPAHDPVSVIDVDRALQALELANPRAARIVELTYFADLNSGETGKVLEIADRTVERDLKWARRWLKKFLEEAYDEAGRT